MTINNWDAETDTLKYTDRDLLDPGKKVELRMGYRGKNSQEELPVMIRGKIKSLRYSYPAAGGPTVSISGSRK